MRDKLGTPTKQFAVIEVPELEWPASFRIPSPRFRLFVAANTSELPVEIMSRFVTAALSAGMVYFCAWGSGCERFHDIVDEILVEDDLGPRKFAGPTSNDKVMTTWHSQDTLEEALDFFATFAIPTDGFKRDSGFRVVVCLSNSGWAAIARSVIGSAEFSA